jgi:hypothetical protein
MQASEVWEVTYERSAFSRFFDEDPGARQSLDGSASRGLGVGFFTQLVQRSARMRTVSLTVAELSP